MSEGEERFNPDVEKAPLEEVVLLLKPGAASEEDRLRAFLEGHQIMVEDRQERIFDRDTIQSFYPNGEPYFDQMTEFYSTEPTIALLVKGPNAIAVCLKMKHRVRGMLKLQRPADGLHSSDTPEKAQREKDSLGLKSPEDA